MDPLRRTVPWQVLATRPVAPRRGRSRHTTTAAADGLPSAVEPAATSITEPPSRRMTTSEARPALRDSGSYERRRAALLLKGAAIHCIHASADFYRGGSAESGWSRSRGGRVTFDVRCKPHRHPHSNQVTIFCAVGDQARPPRDSEQRAPAGSRLFVAVHPDQRSRPAA